MIFVSFEISKRLDTLVNRLNYDKIIVVVISQAFSKQYILAFLNPHRFGIRPTLNL